MKEVMLLHIFYFGVINIVILLEGYQFIKKAKVLQGWIMFVMSIVIIDILFLHEHPVLRMFTLITTTFTSMKVISVSESYKKKPLTLSFSQWLVFVVGWAGMCAEAFESLGGKPLPGAWLKVKFGVSRLIAGVSLLVSVHVIHSFSFHTSFVYLIENALLLAGLSLILHFGLLSISAGMWRLTGVNTYLLFRQPLKAKSLSEFWSKRWNIAFSEMTAVAVYRRLKIKFGSTTALLGGFIFSGILHEIALSVPVNSGYGFPTLYFVIQGIMVIVENRLLWKQVTLLQNKVVARLWVIFWVVVPLPLLFSVQFIEKVVRPLGGLFL